MRARQLFDSREALDLEHDPTSLASTGRRVYFDIPADHHTHKVFQRSICDLARSGQSTVAEHGIAITDLWHFDQPVGHIDHADAVRFEIPNDRMQLLHFAITQCSGRFVENDQFGIDGERASDFYQLLFGHA